MGRTSAPPLKEGLLRQARLRKRMQQNDVLHACAERGLVIGQYHLSKLETGAIKWPSLRILTVLADVLDLEYDDLFETEESPAEEAPGAKVAAA